MSEPKRAVIYRRVSTTDQSQNTSLDTQLETGLLTAAQMGYRVVEVCTDDGVSGSLMSARPGIMRALGLLTAKEADVLIAAKLDRISRKTSVTLSIVEKIHAAGGEVLAGQFRFDRTPQGSATLSLFATMAQFERDNIRDRTMSGRLHRANEGVQPSRSRSPFGYHVVTKIDHEHGLYNDEPAGSYIVLPEQARVVAEVFARYDAGESLRSICRWLEAAGIGPARGGEYWRSSALHKMLVNPVYKGAATFGLRQREVTEVGEKTHVKLTYRDSHVSIACPALVSAELFDGVQVRLTAARHSGDPDTKHALTGMLRCPLCGRNMGGTRRERQGKTQTVIEHYYQCPDSRKSRNSGGVVCNKKRVRAGHAEQSIRKGLLDVAANPALISQAAAAYRRGQSAGYDPLEAGRVEAALRTLDARERATVEAQVAGIQAGASPAVYAGAFGRIAGERQALTARLKELEAQRQQATAPERDGDEAALQAQALADVEEALRSGFLSDAQKHDLLAKVVESVTPEDVNGEEGYRLTLRPFDQSAGSKHRTFADVAHNIMML